MSLLAAVGLGAATSVLGGIFGNKAAGAAATAQKDSAAVNERIATADREFAKQQYSDSRLNFSPYLTAGRNALRSLGDLQGQGYQGYNPSMADYGNPNIGFNGPAVQDFGLNPNLNYGGSTNFNSGIDPNLSRTGVQLNSPEASRWGGNTNIQVNALSDPSFRFGQQQGMQGITNSASAGGMTLSGRTLKDISRFNNDYSSTKYGEAYNRASQDYNRQYQQDQDYFGAQRMVGLDQFGAQGTEADRAYAVAQGNYDRGEAQFGANFGRQQGYYDRTADMQGQNYNRGYQSMSDLYARGNARAMDQYNIGSQNYARNAGLMDQMFNRQYGMFGDDFNRYSTLANYGSAAAAGQSGAGANAANTMAGIGVNQMSNNTSTYNNLGQIQAANAYAPVNAMLGGANVGLSMYSMMNPSSFSGATPIGSGYNGTMGSGAYNNPNFLTLGG